MIYHIEIDLNFSVIQMVLTMYGLFTVRLGTSTSLREHSKCNCTVHFVMAFAIQSARSRITGNERAAITSMSPHE